MTTRTRLATLLIATLCLAPAALAESDCTCESKNKPASTTSEHTAPEKAPEKDRQAILAMAGDYKVTFQFQETVVVQPGYELKDPYQTEATEFVEVIEDTGDFISLQHVLVLLNDDPESEPSVVKHWRQDWQYEDTQINAYRGNATGNKTWEHVELSPAEVKGTWSQAVYQVDDSPRYEAIGKWTHTGDRSAWESAETWRPLPRREYTKRHDYNVMVGRNRHTITPNGWVHEQDNYKLILDDAGQPKQVLVHESGLNVYDKVDDIDFAAGHEYWDATKVYWQDVRAVWADLLSQPGTLTLKGKVDGNRLHQVLFALAQEVKDSDSYNSSAMRPQIAERIDRFVAE